jgi:hypothetical protein
MPHAQSQTALSPKGFLCSRKGPQIGLVVGINARARRFFRPSSHTYAFPSLSHHRNLFRSAGRLSRCDGSVAIFLNVLSRRRRQLISRH